LTFKPPPTDTESSHFADDQERRRDNVMLLRKVGQVFESAVYDSLIVARATFYDCNRRVR
jgi:hypothetical protein